MNRAIYLIFLVILTSLNFPSNPLEKKLNLFIVNQKRYLTYKPKTIKERNEMTLGIGRIDTNNTVYYKNVISYRKNNLPDNRKPNNYISYTFIKYKDSTQCKEALLSWLNCFGNDCTKIKLNEDRMGFKTTPMFVIINSDEILIAHTQCEFYYNSALPKNKSELWQTVIDDFKSHFSNSNSVFIDVGCGGPLNWIAK